MRRRRLEDRSPSMVLVMDLTRREGSEAGGELAAAVRILHEHRRESDPLAAHPAGEGTALILVDTGGCDVLCLNAVELEHRSRPESGMLSELAVAEAAVLRARSAQTLRKHHFAERFVVFTERLARSETTAEVRDAVLQSLTGLFCVFRTAVFARGGGDAFLWPLGGRGEETTAPLPPSVLLREEPGPIGLAETGVGRPFEALAPLVSGTGAASLAGVAIGQLGFMVLLERRADRSFDGEDWFRMQVVARQLERALQRVGLRDPGVPLPGWA